MRPPRQRDPGRGPGAAANTIIHHTDQRADTTATDRRYPIVTASAYPPAGRRRLWLLLVSHCVLCQCAHAHRSSVPCGGLRAAGCGRGDYLVVVREAGRVVA